MLCKQVVITLSTIAVFPVLFGMPTMAAEPKPVKFESPQQVFNAMRDAQASQNWEGMYRCMTPKSLDYSIGLLVFTAAYHEGNPVLGEPLRRIMTRHGVDLAAIKRASEEDASKGASEENDQEEELTDERFLAFLDDVTRNVQDKPAMLGEAMKWQMTSQMSLLTDKEKKERQEAMEEILQIAKKISLVDVKIEGDKATGTRIVPGAADKETIEFRKISDSWLIEYDPR